MNMKSEEIRKRFLDFFESKGHKIVPSDSLIPKNDPSLLFTSAGMNQFKEQFMGKNIQFSKAATCQKCIRTGDLENVGRTNSHHTFFEMLGNFSFGDYFKKDACLWAWEFITENLKISPQKLWISVYTEDKETFDIWHGTVGVPKEKIVKLDAKDNFWPSNAILDGPNGPCGPCSEIYYDWGKETGCGKGSCKPGCDCGRFVEVWNLVFTQFNRTGVNKSEPLPTKNIDTGMGLERITAVMQQVKNNFETDLFKPIIEEIKETDANTIADHLRAVIFLIGDDVYPSNEERGYVTRKLIRRAYLLGKSSEPFLYKHVPKIVKIMECAYPELAQKRENITIRIKREEEKFQHTLDSALPKLDEAIVKFRKEKEIPGKIIFKLVDTYGLPIERIEETAKRHKYKLGMKDFELFKNDQKYRSRDKSKIDSNIFVKDRFEKAPKPEYSDSNPLKNAKIVYLIRRNSTEASDQVLANEEIEILTDPQSALFYKEAGGQVGDAGTIKSEPDGSITKIINTYEEDGRVIHHCISGGQLGRGNRVTVMLNTERKEKIARNHTGTHLLHSALRKVLGSHVKQAGSLVDDKKLRFDFTHDKKLDDRELERIEELVNEKINEAVDVNKQEKSISQAKEEGALAFFGEKYDEKVRVVTIGDYSKELCGGSHISNTSQIGLFSIKKESSVAAGIRRIEAVTGKIAKQWEKEKVVKDSEQKEALAQKEKAKEKAKKRMHELREDLDSFLAKKKTLSGIPFIIDTVDDADIKALRCIADSIKAREPKLLVLLFSKSNDKVQLIISVPDDVVAKGLKAGELAKDIAKALGGSGGGRKDFAQAGGKDPKKIDEAVRVAKEKIKSL